MIKKNQDVSNWATDLDALLEFDPSVECYWTAPKWMTEGDILFFYHTISARQRIGRLLKQAEQIPDEKLTRVLQHAADLANVYSGTIFGCAQVAGRSKYLLDEDNLQHFRSRRFAPLGRVHIFPSPLGADKFRDFLVIRGAISPLGRRKFEGIREQLCERNDLPGFLRNARFGERAFQDLNRTNWISISCDRDARFIREDQIRDYFADYLLGELKDKRTSLLRECKCFRDDQMTGIADYFVRLHGKWVPVEAKVNIQAEGDLASQLAQYIHIDSFRPTQQPHRGKRFQVDDVPICLVVDEAGIYVTSDAEFQGARRGEPNWKREELGQPTISEIRAELQSRLSC